MGKDAKPRVRTYSLFEMRVAALFDQASGDDNYCSSS